MAFNVPIPIIELVKRYDFADIPLPMNQPINILLGEISYERTSGNQLYGFMKDPRMFDSNFLLNHQCGPYELKGTNNKLYIEVGEHDCHWMYDAQQIYFHQVQIDEAHPDYLRILPNSLVIPWNDDYLSGNHPQNWFVEQFAGGIGGWHAAKKHLQQQKQIGFGLRTVAIESHLPYAVQFSLTHDFTILGDVASVPPEFLHSHHRDTMFVCPIQDLSWQKQISKLPLQIWSISAPCQSWSLAGYQRGFMQPNGMNLADSISQIRIFRPKAVAIEQVAGFPQHEHFPLACKLMTWAGYTLFHAGVFDHTTLTPAKRARWLGIFIRSDLECDIVEKMEWPVILPAVPKNFDVQLHLEHQERIQFEPSYQVAERYFDPLLMPGKLKNWTKSEILDARVPTCDMKVPTFMHAYGAQHELAPYLLGTNGLFGHFVRQGPAFRFWTPCECMMIHGHDQPVALFKPPRLSWETIGNSIAMPHALYALYKAFQITQMLLTDDSFEDIARSFIDRRFKASETTILQDQFAWFMGTPEDASNLQRRVEMFVIQMCWGDSKPDRIWPPSTYYSTEQGLQVFHAVQNMIHPTDLMDISPTLQFDMIFEVFLLASRGEYGVLKVNGWTTWQTLLMLWGFRFLPSQPNWTVEQLHEPLQTTASDLKVVLTPHDTPKVIEQCETALGLFSVPILIRDDVDLTLYEIEDSSLWHKTRPAQQVHDVFAEWEPITPDSKFRFPTEIGVKCQEPKQDRDCKVPWDSVSKVCIEPLMPPQTDILIFHCEALPEDLHNLKNLWMNADQQQWYHSKGRQCNLQIIDDCTYRFLFRPLHGTTTTPVIIFRRLLLQRFMRLAFLGDFQVGKDDLVPVVIKYHGSIILEGHASRIVNFEQWLRSLEHLFQMTVHPGPPHMICAGQRVTEACTMQDLITRRDWKSRPITIHIGESILGGTKTTSKQDFKRLIESGIANLFLEYGLDLPQVTSSTSILIESVGLPRLHHLLHGEPETDRYMSFERLCKAMELPLPERTTKRSHTDGKFRKIRAQAQVRDNGALTAENFLLQDGFFLNADGSAATILTQYSPNASGVILMTPAKAQEWINAAADKSPDELGIYVLGPHKINTRFPMININAPAKDNTGRSVLLNGCLVQMGEKHIAIPASENSIETNDVQVASVTMWQEDFEPSLWNRIIESPVRAAKDLLALDGHQGIMGKPWARVFQDKGVSVVPALASSVQFHAEFQKGPRFLALLKRSGFNKIYITPKNEDGRPDPAWKIIWLTDTVLQIESKATCIHGSAGLVKGKKSKGLRVEQASFRTTWEKLKPGTEAPDIRSTQFVYRLQPLPLGIDAQNLTAWGKQIKWDIRPIRAVGAKQWVVGSNEQPPNIVMFNGQPLLVQQLHQKQIDGTGVIAAGPRHQPKAKGASKRARKEKSCQCLSKR